MHTLITCTDSFRAEKPLTARMSNKTAMIHHHYMFEVLAIISISYAHIVLTRDAC